MEGRSPGHGLARGWRGVSLFGHSGREPVAAPGRAGESPWAGDSINEGGTEVKRGVRGCQELMKYEDTLTTEVPGTKLVTTVP